MDDLAAGCAVAPPMAWFAGVMAVAPRLGGRPRRRRPDLLGAPIWLKPLKFAISMAVYA